MTTGTARNTTDQFQFCAKLDSSGCPTYDVAIICTQPSSQPGTKAQHLTPLDRRAGPETPGGGSETASVLGSPGNRDGREKWASLRTEPGGRPVTMG